MASRQWYIRYNDSVHGPFTSGQLKKMAQRSQLTPDVQIRVGETGDWRKASSVKGLFINSAHDSSELSSDDITPPDNASNSESDQDIPLPQFTPPAPQPGDISVPPSSTPASSFGEVSSVAPPLPGEAPITGQAPPLPTDYPNSSQPIGEMPSPPPPVSGEKLNLFSSFSNNSNKKSDKSQTPPPIPKLIQTLLGADEQIVFIFQPSFNVLALKEGIAILIYVLLGLIPGSLMISNSNSAEGLGYLFYATIALIVVSVVYYLKWIHAYYVITNQRTFVKSGIFSISVAYIYNANIEMFKVRAGLVDAILRLNTIELRTNAGFLTLRWIHLANVLQFYKK